MLLCNSSWNVVNDSSNHVACWREVYYYFSKNQTYYFQQEDEKMISYIHVLEVGLFFYLATVLHRESFSSENVHFLLILYLI